MQLRAPRILNDPPRCKHSGLSQSSRPATSLRAWVAMAGVRLMCLSTRAAAARTSFIDTDIYHRRWLLFERITDVAVGQLACLLDTGMSLRQGSVYVKVP